MIANAMHAAYPEERQAEILKRIKRAGRVSGRELSRSFGVSDVTIRGDLQALADRRLLTRTHGGAVLRLPELSLALRRKKQAVEKTRIGAAAAAMVRDGETVFLDASSTSLAMTAHLRPRKDLTVVTNGLAVAQSFLDAPGVTVVLVGGILQRETASLVGLEGMTGLPVSRMQKGFFGAHSFTEADGLADASAADAEVKRHMVKRCRRAIAVLDATKWEWTGLPRYARLKDVQTIITGRKAPRSLVRQVRAAGIDVILV